jgi:hypothetical protein
MCPTNPSNCKAKYKDFVKPQMLIQAEFRIPRSPESRMLQNFMKVGILDNCRVKREGSPLSLVPPLSAPPVTLPPVTLPPVTLPPVTLPPITLPPITLPIKSVPDLASPQEV